MAARDLVDGFLSAVLAPDPARLRDLLAPDVVWHLPRSALPEYAGPHVGQDKIIQFLKMVSQHIYTPGTARHHDLVVVSEGDLLAAMFKISGKLAQGAEYLNDYVYFIRLAQGRIAEVWEMLDTKQFGDIISRSASGSAAPAANTNQAAQ